MRSIFTENPDGSGGFRLKSVLTFLHPTKSLLQVLALFVIEFAANKG